MIRTLRTALAGIAVTVLAFAALASAVPVAHAEPATITASPSDINLAAATSLTITKLEQPQAFGQPSDGLPIADLSGYTPIAGVTFAATLVPLSHPLNTNDGWQQAAKLSVTEAENLVSGTAPRAVGTTNAGGNLAFNTLGVGLYLIEETATPAGVVAGDPFLVVLPIPHPTSTNSWLYDVHVYPKNARVAVSLDVVDRDAFTVDGAVSGGAGAADAANTVTWNARADIPRQGATDGYQIVSMVDASLRFLATPPGTTPTSHPGGVSVSLSGNSGIALTPADYSLTTPSGAGGEIVVTLRPSGLIKVDGAKAADADTQVRLSYVTQVLAEGELTNEVRLCASLACIAGTENGDAVGTGATSDMATTKWGPLKILVHEVDKPATLIPGAKFELYLSEADARAKKNPISAGGATEWVTDSQGRITVPGLRFSNFVDGQQRTEDDPLYRQYWAVLSHVPSGWQGASAPIAMAVTTVSTVDAQLAIVELARSGSSDGSGGGSIIDGGLAITGAQAGLAATGLALILGVLGALVLVLKRRLEKRGQPQA